MFKLFARVSNGGDGSAIIYFSHDGDACAREDDEEQERGEGFAEPTLTSVTLRINDGVIEYQEEWPKRQWAALQEEK